MINNNYEKYKVIVDCENPTVCKTFEHPLFSTLGLDLNEKDYQNKLIDQLKQQGYEYLSDVHNHCELLKNLRLKICELNRIELSNNEWQQVENYIIDKNDNIIDVQKKIFNDKGLMTINLDSGKTINIKLIDFEYPINNYLQVCTEVNNEAINDISKNRYDVIILVNGLPFVNIELKRPSVSINQAFNQINRYRQNDYAGLFKYLSLFIFSNVSETKYLSNCIKTNKSESASMYSFDFSIYWSDQKNKRILNLYDFAATFLAQRTLLNVLFKYSVFTSENKLLIMRPYQIVAAENILIKILHSINNKDLLGTNKAGGYIWHTTGSGKTLTSFKVAQIAREFEDVKKVLFVVDRKDLDYQTINEYEKFEKGCASSNKSTAILQGQLEKNDPDKKVIVTTIQKLNNFVKSNKKHNIYNEHVVLIFDECHRSQLGDMKKNITDYFKKYNNFGFTGTPIFSENSKELSNAQLIQNVKKDKVTIVERTTEQQFGDCLHKYTIVNAIDDNNVLRFKYSYVSTINGIGKQIEHESETDKTIDTKAVVLNPKRIANNVKFILDNFANQTYRNPNGEYIFKKSTGEFKTTNGFNSIMTVTSIEHLRIYYEEFKKQLLINNPLNLKIATIFSYAVNDKVSDTDILDEEDENVESLDKLSSSDKEFLNSVIQDYNKQFNTNFSLDIKSFDNYYKDISKRTKDKEIDILLVVNMFLTGFDAPTVNTLWVDRKMKDHTLMQAFSRTNRIFNNKKEFGNIVSFFSLKDNLDEALKLFGDDGGTIAILRSFNDYYLGYKDKDNNTELGYKTYVEDLRNKFPINKNDLLMSVEDKKEFINLFSKFLKSRNLLNSFTNDFTDDKKIIIGNELDKYIGWYNQFGHELKQSTNNEKVDVSDSLNFNSELVSEYDINIAYIWKLCVEDKNSDGTINQQTIDLIATKLKASSRLYPIREQILKLLKTMEKDKLQNPNDFEKQFSDLIKKEKDNDLNKIIEEFEMDKDFVNNYINHQLDNLNFEISLLGDDLAKAFPDNNNPFYDDGDWNKRCSNGIIALQNFMDKYKDLN